MQKHCPHHRIATLTCLFAPHGSVPSGRLSVTMPLIRSNTEKSFRPSPTEEKCGLRASFAFTPSIQQQFSSRRTLRAARPTFLLHCEMSTVLALRVARL